MKMIWKRIGDVFAMAGAVTLFLVMLGLVILAFLPILVMCAIWLVVAREKKQSEQRW